MSDIWVICQKCQYGGAKKNIYPLDLIQIIVQASMRQITCKTDYVVIMQRPWKILYIEFISIFAWILQKISLNGGSRKGCINEISTEKSRLKRWIQIQFVNPPQYLLLNWYAAPPAAATAAAAENWVEIKNSFTQLLIRETNNVGMFANFK